MRQRERDERKRDRTDSRDSRDPTTAGGHDAQTARDALPSAGGASVPGGVGGGGREPKRQAKGERGSGRPGDSFAGGAGGPPFRDLENWDPEKVGRGAWEGGGEVYSIGEVYSMSCMAVVV